jgi:hypothetical protein
VLRAGSSRVVLSGAKDLGSWLGVNSAKDLGPPADGLRVISAKNPGIGGMKLIGRSFVARRGELLRMTAQGVFASLLGPAEGHE